MTRPDFESHMEQVASPYASPSPEEAQTLLDGLNARVRACTACGELAEARTQTVFGVGDPAPEICFVGEAPGMNEDRQGEPFVGAAGQLLTRIISACGLARGDVYICNILKCRPPENRQPLPAEVGQCVPYLHKQLAVLKPSMICCLGGTAARTLLASDRSMGGLRGRIFDYRGTPLVCTYHPAYLLRNPEKKRDVWEDMKLLLRQIGREPPGAS